MTDTEADVPSLTTFRQTELGDHRVVLASTGSTTAEPVLRAIDGWRLATAIRQAVDQRIPFVLTLRTTGVAVEDGIGAAAGWAGAARELVLASGVVPTVAIVSGPVVSGPALLLGLFDIVILTNDSYVYVNGPRSVETYTGVPVSGLELGGASTHLRLTGLASMLVETVEEALTATGDILAHLPESVDELPQIIETADPEDRLCPDLGSLLPSTPAGSYDVRDVITDVVDDGHFLELRSGWSPNLVTGFAALGGMPVGIVANQTQSLAGSIDISAAQKGGRFVAMCDAFNVPLITMVDTSGFLPGKDLEWRGMIRHGAQMAFAYARATVPRIGLILRKSYGGAYIVMDSVNMGNDLMLAWPSAEVAVMGAKGAVEILHRESSPEERAELEAGYEAQYLTPYPAAERSSITAVIDPADTRRELVAGLRMLSSKRERLPGRRHDNSPL
ncbi:MAG: methylmalonyl-CoA carboxyltransferase [Acidimicrobiia bacterium]|nr:methylmalonyl-CoA carboxyltransferase [Acidimicrobiia bacterium]